MQDFVHLHNHSEYSLLDGANRVKDLVRLAVEHEMPAVALTDHGVMHGAVEFATRCQDAGITPIVGCEVYTSGERPRQGKDPRLDKENFHLLLLAQNEVGYRNLVHLVSQANIDGFYYKPRVDHELLAQHSEGVICSTACLGGEVQQAIHHDQPAKALEIAAKYRDIFTPERYFIELQTHGIPEEKHVNDGLLRIAKELSLPLIVTNDIHYGTRADADPHDVLLCIGTGAKVAEPNRMRYPTHEFYFKTAQEMAALFPDHPEAVSNTVRIAETVDLKIKTGDMILPHYAVPEGFTYDSFFEKCCWEGAQRRYGSVTPEQKQRIEYEMHVIEVKGYSAYFLIVADFVRWAHARGIPARCRGSAAGSVVSFLLGITNVDPLLYGLLFERFLYMERITPPDIDLDFADYRREEVIQYCRDKYGPDHVAQIITFGTLGARAAIRDVARAMELPLAEADKLAKLIPQHPGKHFSIKDCLKDVPELARKYGEEPQTKEVLDTAIAIEGLSRHSSVHAAAVVITPGPVTDYVPVQRSDTGLITQYDMNWVSALGLLKMDFLGLRTLTVVEHCIRLMHENHADEIDADFDIDAVPKDDPKTFKLLQAGQTAGVFQLESDGMRNLVRDIRPIEFEDLIPLVALYRPGPLGNGDTERFIKRRHKMEKVSYIHPVLEPILNKTYGIFVYQEQILKVAMQVAGMGARDADNILRAMSKKKLDKMMSVKPAFVSGAAKTSNLSAKESAEIFDAMASFAAYGFNQNHSGAYAILTYQTAWLKANFPTDFMAALLTSISDNKDKVAAYIDDCRQMDPPIAVMAPDVNRSVSDFSVDAAPPIAEAPVVRFGLFAIKGVGEGPVSAILEERKAGGLFRSIFDFCQRVDTSRCQKSAVEAIVKAGGFDSLHPNRNQVLHALEDAFAMAQRARKERETGQVAMFDLLAGGDDDAPSPDPPLPSVPEIPQAEKLAMEKDLLGLYLSDHPFLAFRERVQRFGAITSEQLKSMGDKEDVVVAGIVAGIRKTITRKTSSEMAILTIEDLQGKLSATLFPKSWDLYRDSIAVDKVVIVKGKANHRERLRANDDGETVDIEVLADEVLVLNAEDAGAPNGGAAHGNGNGNGNGNGKVTAASRVYDALHLDLTRVDPVTVDHVKKLLAHFPGNSQVVVHTRGHRVLSAMRVSACQDVCQELAKLLGAAAVWLE
ncbi:MAG TPA: DNA polymerase III subunit alpha [Armatimonadota bacterium]|jgi:DNA polymerase-3 subunit alpha